MSLFKGIIPSALAVSFLGLSACGSVDNDPPKLESTFGTVSAMDTLVAVFDKEIDDFDDSLVTSNQPITVVKQKGKKIYIVGATDTVASIPRFAVSSDYDTLKFANIKDEDGNKSKLQTVTFSTYAFIDSDEYEYNEKGTCYSNKKPADADVLTDSTGSKFYDGTKTTKTLTVTGILGGQYSKNCEDDADTYRIFLKKRDTVSVQLEILSADIPLQLAVLGPSKIKAAPDECTDDNQEFFSVDMNGKKKMVAIDTTFGIGDIHECGTTTITDELAYYIQVRYSDELTTSEQRPQAYKLSVTLQ
ncbi:MAG: hypothetical protein SPL19_04565 [Fibrobacter sp.]|jgi:hypothetical protein|nr:hypothetical protein [Fibrobacter sp.]MDY6369683.1 hypothetical protein [Fibrobacter sp.]MDY6389614.1 hypothetical protein [Fibrobacter sp.]